MNPEGLLAASSPRSLLLAVVFVFGAIPLLDRWAAFHTYFDLDVDLARWLFLPYVALNALASLARSRVQAFTFPVFLLYVASALYLQVYAAFLCMLTSVTAAPAMAALLTLTILAHGQYLFYTSSAPIGPLLSVLVLPFSALLAPTGTHLAIAGFAATAGLFSGTLLGAALLRAEEARRAHAQEREAAQQAQLHKALAHLQTVSDVTHQLLGNYHDLRNALMVLRVNGEYIAREVLREPTLDPEMRLAANDLVEGLNHTAQVVEHARHLAQLHGAELARHLTTTAVAPSLGQTTYRPIVPDLEKSIQAVSTRFANVSIFCCIPDELRTLEARCASAEHSFRRVFENLLINAAEGDGVRHAQRVEIRASREDDLVLRLVIADDGPGFPPELLELSHHGFQTTKPDGSGLGLLTSEKLVEACGGRLELRNSPHGGAVVTISLPCKP